MTEQVLDTSIHVAHWGTAKYWTWEEFEYLAVGIDPFKFKSLGPGLLIDDKREERQKIREHLKFHFREYESLFGKMSPIDGVDFAARASVSFPEALISEVTRFSTSSRSEAGQELLGAELNAHKKLLRTFLGVTVARYGYDPDAERQKAITDIVADLEAVGVTADPKTIRARLTEAFETLNADQEEKLKLFIRDRKRNL